MSSIRIINADVLDGLKKLKDESVHCVVTSPPYWGLRDYGVEGQIGLEKTLQEYIGNLVLAFREVRRVLRKDGTFWLNIGDAYAGYHGNKNSEIPSSATNGWTNGTNENKRYSAIYQGFKQKDLLLIPARVAMALQDDGWYLRSEIIWHKPNPMPESVTDRPTNAHEKVFLLTKQTRYFYDIEAAKEDSVHSANQRKHIITDGRKPLRNEVESRHRSAINGGQSLQANPNGKRNMRNVWQISTVPYPEAHFATFPPELVERCIKAGSSERGCCQNCGAPWRRKFERTTEPDPSYKGSAFDKGKTGARDGGDRTQPGERYLKQQAGWQPSCECASGTKSCVVLDPFGGSGTTGMVAQRLFRDSILIELNPSYVEMMERRLHKDGALFCETVREGAA